MLNYYQILNLSPQTTEEDIKKAYRKLAMAYTHLPVPEYSTDYNLRELSDSEKQDFQQIQTAYAVLSDPKLKAEYDAELASNGSRQLRTLTC